MSGPRYPGLDTLSLHAGQQPDSDFGSRAQPIYQTTSYVFESSDQASARFDSAAAGHVYSRISNPTVSVLEERVAALEGGVSAVATASGMAAIHLAITTLCQAGDHIVAARSLYGGTHNLLAYAMPKFGIETTFVDPRDPSAFKAAIKDNTKMVLAESISNPMCEILDFEAVAAVAHDAKIPLVIDATLSTPVLCKPIEFGADVVVHSLTKFMGGHGIAVGGALVDSGRFDWEASGKFPDFCSADPALRGMNAHDDFAPAALSVRARKGGLRDFGASMAPSNAFYLLQGIETLSLRMQRHIDNSQKIVEFLEGQESVSAVHHPAAKGHPDAKLAERYMPNGSAAVFSFELKGGRAAGAAFIDALQLFSHLANVGDAKSLVIHPASTTHSRMGPEALAEAGIAPGLVRLSIGLESVQDLLADLKQALRRAEKASS